jgi:2-desacetyl-2-hydroxyethyl bacteriochlorophyllide A dehydrogenase
MAVPLIPDIAAAETSRQPTRRPFGRLRWRRIWDIYRCMQTARAFWWTGPLEGEIRDVPLPERGAEDVLVRTLVSGVSRGSESLVAQGRVPESQWERMRCPFQEGSFPFPVKYGYCAVGEVEEGPRELEGSRVFILHPHQTRLVVPAKAATLLPDDMPVERAVLAANLETALNAVWDANALPGDRISVVGAGVVGALVAYVASRIAGTEVTLVDRDEGKAELARALGCAFAPAHSPPEEADIVFEASGDPTALAACLRLAAFEGTVLAVAWYGDKEAALPLGEDFHSRRLRLISSQVSAVSDRQRPRWNHGRRMAKVVEVLRDPVLDVLLEGESPFEAMPEVMPGLVTAGGGLCHRIRYG